MRAAGVKCEYGCCIFRFRIFDFIRAPDGKRCGVRPYAGQSGAFCVQKAVFRHTEYGSPPRGSTYPAHPAAYSALHRPAGTTAAANSHRHIRRGEQPVIIDGAAGFRIRKRPANARRGSADLFARHTDGGMQNMHFIRQLEKSAGCIANSPFFRPESRLPARIATVTV